MGGAARDDYRNRAGADTRETHPGGVVFPNYFRVAADDRAYRGGPDLALLARRAQRNRQLLSRGCRKRPALFATARFCAAVVAGRPRPGDGVDRRQRRVAVDAVYFYDRAGGVARTAR